METQPVLHIISHTDLDGVAAAALAWHANSGIGRLIKMSFSGYVDVDNHILETLRAGEEPLVCDLFCQRQETVDEIDKTYSAEKPFLFDHHESNLDKYGNRKWNVIDTSCCGAMVYWKWLMDSELEPERRAKIAAMEPLMLVANDRDLWLGQIPDSRLWQALITMCGPWSVLMRLVAAPSAELTSAERSGAEDFTEKQEARFAAAKEKMMRTGSDLCFVPYGALERGDASDFCGLILDREPDPPLVTAVTGKRPSGDWAVSLRSRDGLAGRVVTLLKDGKKVRGGGHDDASAVYFPRSYNEADIQQAIVSAIRTEKENNQQVNVTLGDLFKGLKQ